MKNLEVKKDYVNKGGLIVIDRSGDTTNRGFDGNNFEYDLFCSCPHVWREATEEEVVEAFEKHLVYRYGEDWETMKIKERHPDSGGDINNGFWNVEIRKLLDGWNVYNKNGMLYCGGIWVERLEDKEINIKASETQIGGSHYSEMAIQPTEFIHKNNLSFIQGNIIKYVCRYKLKGGIEDLNKAKHYIDLLIEFEEE